jgi:hypothetical protein
MPWKTSKFERHQDLDRDILFIKGVIQMVKLTANFYDADTGEYIEIEDGEVVARHQSILSKQERLTINRKRAERLISQQANIVTETPLVMPEMYPSDKPVANDGPLVQPKMTWDQPNKQANQEVTGNPIPRMEW